MEPIVVATWGLAAATGLLVFVSFLQYKAIRRQADTADVRDRDQMAILTRQTDELAASARASSAMVEEMIEARKAANPLRLAIKDRTQQTNILGGVLYNVGDRAEILLRAELLVGQDVVDSMAWSNCYLRPSTTVGDGQPFRFQFPLGASDLVTLRITGRPQDGLEQTREFLFRVTGSGALEDLAERPPRTSAGGVV